MPKNRARKRLNSLVVALQTDPIWLIEPQYHDSLRAAIVAAWSIDGLSDEHIEQLATRRGMRGASDEMMQTVDGVGVLSITGMLRAKPDIFTEYGLGVATSEIKARAIEALGSNDVRALLINIDSGGGQAAGVFDAVEQIRAAANGKPVWAYVDGMAASGGYAFATAADRIIASPGSEVGSIGAYAIHSQYRPEDTAYTVFRYGENKALGLPVESLTDAAKAEWQSRIDKLGRRFESVVAEGRGISVATVQEKFGRGRMFDVPEAVKLGMVDATSPTLQATLDELRRTIGAPQTNSATTRAPQLNRESRKVDATRATAWTISEGIMSKKIKAALFAVGLIAAVDVADDVCDAVLSGIFAGKERPKDEDGVVSAIAASKVKPVLAAAAEPLKQTNSLQAVHDREQAEAKAEAKAAAQAEERERVKSLRALAKSMKVDGNVIDEAIDAGETLVQAAQRFAKAVESKPIGQISTSEGGAEAFAKDAIDALSMRVGIKVDKPSDQAARWGRGGVELHYLARQSLLVQGQRVDDMADREQVARAALSFGGSRQEVLISDDGAYNRPASFPNLLSALSNKIFDEGVMRANATYADWTGVIAGGLPDLKPAPVVARSTVYALDEIIDDDGLKELAISEQLMSSIQVRRFANKFGWTPVMVANDDLNAFAEGLLGFGQAAETTINLLCLNLLAGNPVMLDGYSLFDDTNHGNDVSSGAAPSDSQWSAMELKLSAQRPVGGQGYVREQLGVVLTPPKWKPDAMRTFSTFQLIGETKQAATTDNLALYRGQVKVVIEPELAGYHATRYYGLCDPNRQPVVVRGYQRGWGEGPRRTTWTDAETGTAWTKYELRVGAAIRDYRVAVRNNGA